MDRYIKSKPLPSWIDEQQTPNTAFYARVHGAEKLMPKWIKPGKYDSQEQVYEVCLENGCTWQELLDFKGYQKGVLL